ncbi:MAG: hypothetical protein Greene041679_675, partial [Parcubacteria group bacterium Greene0416_79]
MKEVVIIGFGWVGQANALALSFLGYRVFFYDLTKAPARHYEKEWSRFYERVRSLEDPLAEDRVETVYLVCVGDQVNQDGLQDISQISKALKMLTDAKGTVVLRSTVLPEHLGKVRFDYYLPEFLHEKHAVEECIHPYLFVIGKGNTHRAEPAFFADWERRAAKVFRGTPREAAYLTYLSNIWNALRISFTNEMGDIVS